LVFGKWNNNAQTNVILIRSECDLELIRKLTEGRFNPLLKFLFHFTLEQVNQRNNDTKTAKATREKMKEKKILAQDRDPN
jgi:hypothetical protein